MNILEMKNIYKSFGSVNVLNDVNLTVQKGEIHALLGENGAGKSTLMNILTGSLKPDSGTIFFNNSEMKNPTIKQTEQLGIAFVHQELNLFNDLKVYENIFFGNEITNKFGKLNKKEMIQMTHELFKDLGTDIDPKEVVRNLSVSQKQLIEISKALFTNAKLLILDEPTTSLNNEEIEQLFGILDKLKNEGKTFIFISHKMPEIFQISDSYTVLRNGKFIETGKISEITPFDITKLMVGESYSNADIYEKRTLGDTVLELKNLSGDEFKNINLTLKKGEILGFTGLQGAGNSEVLQTIFGALKTNSGKVIVSNKEIEPNSIQKSMKNKIALLPANRKENSVIPSMSILDNMCISEFILSMKKEHINKNNEVNKYNVYKDKLNIKANSYDDKILSLSGGNQQKVFIARWLNTSAQILLFDNPTQGIDVGAKAEIYKLILELAKAGKTIIISSLEIAELQKVADRCAIFYNGEIIKILEHSEIAEDTVMLYQTNAISEVEGR